MSALGPIASRVRHHAHGPRRAKNPRDWMGAFILCGVMGVLAYAPLAFGAVHPWAYGTVWGALWILAALWIARGWVEGARGPGEWEFWWIRAAFQPFVVLFGLWILLQWIPLPAALVGWLQPHTLQAHLRYDPIAGGIPSTLRLSLYPRATLANAFQLWSYGAVFYLTLYHVKDRKRILGFAFLWVALGAFEALYGLMEYLAGMNRIWWWRNPWSTGSVTGTFVNRNHLAGYLEMTLLVGVGLLLAMRAEMRGTRHLGWRGRLSRMARDDRWIRAGLLCFLCILMGSALLLIFSRGGALALAAVFLPLSVLLLARKANRRLGIAGLAIFCGMVLYAAPLGLGKLVESFGQLEKGLGDRAALWASATRVAREYPLAGAGWGSFEWVSPRFKPENLGENVVEHAHNDWLELWAETGTVGLGLVLAGVAMYLVGGLRAWSQRRNPWAIWLAFGALAAVVVLGTHSFGEHLFHTQANALTLAALMAWGWVVLHHHRGRDGRDTVRWAIRRVKVPRWAGNGGMFLLVCAHLLLGVGMARHLMAEYRVPTERDSTVMRVDVRDLRLLAEAIDLEPENAKRWALLAREAMKQGMTELLLGWARDKGLTPRDGAQGSAGWARAFLERAIRLNPTNPELYQQMGWVLAGEPNWRSQGLAEHALRTAVALEPSRGLRHFHLGHYLILDRRYEEARGSFQEAVRLSPNLQAAVDTEWAMFAKQPLR